MRAANFGAMDGSEETAARWRRETTEGPEYRAGQVRGAFRGDELVGGYTMHERQMRVGTALVSTACIGGVVTQHEHRGTGVGRALMEDAISEAERRRHGLLLLDGIPDFYGRFGFVDVWDLTEHAIDRAAIAPLPPSPYGLRKAGRDDAAALLNLYNWTFARYTGSFVRTLEAQRHQLAWSTDANAPLLAVDRAGRPRGSLTLHDREPRRAEEVTAMDWPATLALLHYHAQHAEGREPIHWALPTESPVAQALADRLCLPDVVGRRRNRTLAAIVSQTYHHPNAGWVARPADVDTLMRSLLPVWRARWAASTKPWRGTLCLAIDDRSFDITLGDDVEIGGEARRTARLTSSALTQLVFGYHDVTYLARLDGNDVPEELMAVLNVLFPPGSAWIAGTDAF